MHPERFAKKLTQVNQANRGQVIPAVKLTKALAHRLIRSDRDKITGYHMESLAIEAFRNYQGPADLKSMVKRLTDYASTAVKQPIKDSTGQSRHVDDYMGGQGSAARQKGGGQFQENARQHRKLQVQRGHRQPVRLLGGVNNLNEWEVHTDLRERKPILSSGQTGQGN